MMLSKKIDIKSVKMGQKPLLIYLIVIV